MSAKRTCILVLGMHRSGTSLLTRIISLLGARLPKTLMAPDGSNQAGYWESQALTAINDDLLSAAKSSWYDWTAIDDSRLFSADLSHFEAEISDTIAQEFSGSPLIVLKDPRISRLMPIYSRALQAQGFDLSCVQITRSPNEVAGSLYRRNKISTSFSFLLWLRHTLEAEQASRGLNRMFVTYSELLENRTQVLHRLSTWGQAFGLLTSEEALNEAAAQVRVELRHHHASQERSLESQELEELIARTHAAIETLGTDPYQSTALDILEQSKAQLDLISAVSGLSFRDLVPHNPDRVTIQLLGPELKLKQEKMVLRQLLTRALSNPLVPIIRLVWYFGARVLALLLQNIHPRAAQELRQTAKAKHPKRYEHRPDA